MELSKLNGHSTIIRKSEKKELVENTPNAYAMVTALRSMGYDVYRALADIVDNSWDASAKHVHIEVDHQDLEYNSGTNHPRFNDNSRIIITDDGCGMSEETLNQAVRFGTNLLHESQDLGKFGMGLKTACLAVGRQFTVLSREKGQPLLRAVHDLDEIKRLNQFVVDRTMPTQEELKWFNKYTKSSVKSGTIIIISKLDRIGVKTADSMADTLRGSKHLRRIFREYIKAGKKITVNRTSLEPFEPSGWDEPATIQYTDGWQEIVINEGCVNQTSMRFRVSRRQLSGAKARGFQDQGVIWVRNGREICAGIEKHLFLRDPRLAGLVAEIKFSGGLLDDQMKIPIQKNSVKPTQSILDILKKEIGPIVRQAKKDAERAKKDSDALDDPELAKQAHDYSAQLKATEKFLDVPAGPLNGQIQGLNGCSRNGNSNNSNGSSTSSSSTGISSSRRKRGGWNFILDYLDMGEYGSVYEYSTDDRVGDFKISCNKNHPYVIKQIVNGEASGKVAAHNILAALALAESQLGEDFEDEMKAFKEKFSTNLRVLTDQVISTL